MTAAPDPDLAWMLALARSSGNRRLEATVQVFVGLLQAGQLQWDATMPALASGIAVAVEEILRATAGDAARADALEVGPRGAWFRTPRGEVVSLETHAHLRRMFALLVDARLANAATAVPKEELIRGAWPGEIVLPAAAANRLHNAIAVLRRLGLRDVLKRVDGGYLLTPAIAVRACRDVDA